ncbi:hypothetical protein H8S95_14090 [Pontibacter sp. KCTC 32443]|uniref:hypothetical protein n=1 Tax=Pontibacter TaxID=323449 RepID=UPI00164E6A58|nr:MULTISPECIES: hypothetical protein [Pontibacter]MBC5775205.1 hypothetical protein [Pontibacter sp. KCTC 32443]
MTRLFFACTLLVTLLMGCSQKEDEVNPFAALEKFPAPIVKVDAPTNAAVGVVTPIEVYFVVNSGCGYFGSFEVEGSGTEQIIKVYAKYRNTICTQDLPTRQQTFEFKPTVKGTYTLQFYYQPDEYITKTIVVGDVATIGQ